MSFEDRLARTPEEFDASTTFENGAQYPAGSRNQNHSGRRAHSLAAELKHAINAYLPLPAKLEPHLQGALRQVLQKSGSLVRPQIVFQMAAAYGLSDSHSKDLAIAIEYFHTASLIFDDLPCMDNALERRGSECVHRKFGEAPAILAALGLINRAYALTWRAVGGSFKDRQSRALIYIEQRLGIGELLNGQSLDLHYSALPHDRQTTEQIAFGKTVSLIRLTLVLPALLGNASEHELHRLERIAKYWGLSYQILDDLKDVLQNAAQTGKTVARDVSLDRPNTALAMGVTAAAERLNRLIHLGDRNLRRLVLSRPAVSFLEKLRAELQDEVTRVTRDVCQIAAGGRSSSSSS
jgi:geranylgeranyl pyrophosphate synthase